MMNKVKNLTCLVFFVAGVVLAVEKSNTVAAKYEGLTSGFLMHAQIGELPEGVVLSSDVLVVSLQDLEDVLKNIPPTLHEEARKNMVFVLEQKMMSGFIEYSAAQWSKESNQEYDDTTKNLMIRDFLSAQVDQVKVSDEEILEFYNNNQDMFAGQKLEHLKSSISLFLKSEKEREAVDLAIDEIGTKYPSIVSATWITEQAKLATDNPVDIAIKNGKPTFVNYGSATCGPCVAMNPIRQKLEVEFAGKIDVLYVDVSEEQIFAARKGVQGVPDLRFYDKDGREVFRHSGFLPEEKIREQFAKLGIE